jgi:hypothetical protein
MAISDCNASSISSDTLRVSARVWRAVAAMSSWYPKYSWTRLKADSGTLLAITKSASRQRSERPVRHAIAGLARQPDPLKIL